MSKEMDIASQGHSWFNWKRKLEKKLSIASHIMETNCGPIEYAVNGQGLPVVVIHSAPGGYDQCLLFATDLVPQFKIIAWSRPGYLRTPITVGRNIEQQTDALVSLLDALKLEKVAVFAPYTGGAIGLELAIRYPERVQGLILESAISQKYILQKNSFRDYIVTKLLRNDFGSWSHLMMAQYLPKITLTNMLKNENTLNPKARNELYKDILNDPKKRDFALKLITTLCPMSLRKTGFENDIEQYMMMPTMVLQNVKCSTLIIHGTADAEIPFYHAEFAAKTIPNAEFEVIENGNHILPLSPFAQRISTHKIEFLKKCW